MCNAKVATPRKLKRIFLASEKRQTLQIDINALHAGKISADDILKYFAYFFQIKEFFFIFYDSPVYRLLY